MNAAGILEGLGAAVLFGVATPIAKRLLPGVGPVLLAGLLYLGAGVGLSLYSALRGGDPASSREAPLRRSDAGWLAGIIGLGGVAGPILLFIGIGRITGVAGSLLLNLELPLTVLLAVGFFGDHLGRRETLAVATIIAAATLLGFAPGSSGNSRIDWLGAACVVGACSCWALDNNFTQRLSLRDPIAVVRMKGLVAGSVSLALALASGSKLPAAATVAMAALLGVLSYGASIVLHIRAVRLIGAARQAGLFAAAPFIGALASIPILGERLHAIDVAAMALMATGVALLLREHHAHLHAHEELEHDHLHVHDEHHRHEHDGPVVEPHTHPHRHMALTHDHPHTPDPHHRHAH